VRTDTGLNSAGVLVRDLCTGLPSTASAVTRPRNADQFDDFTFVDTGGRQCTHKIGMRVTRCLIAMSQLLVGIKAMK